MAFWQADAVSFKDTDGKTVRQMTPFDDESFTFDMTALLVNNGVPSAPVAYLYQAVDGADSQVTLQDPPTLAGNIVTQRVRGLVANTTYRLYVGITTSGNKRFGRLVIECIE